MASILQVVGSWLATAHAGYARFLLFGCLFALHAIALLAIFYVTRRARWRHDRLGWPVLLVEVLYGLLNPLVYLIVLTRVAALASAQSRYLLAPAWLLLVLLWGLRVLGRHPQQDGKLLRRAARVVLGAAFVVVAAYLVKDAPPAIMVIGSTIVSESLTLRSALLGSLIVSVQRTAWLTPVHAPRTPIRDGTGDESGMGTARRALAA